MISARWEADREALRRQQRAQQAKDYVLGETEGWVTDADFEALASTPVTDDELAELAQLAPVRGQYRRGDTRGYVEAHEDACARYNCWMVRDDGGKESYLSEAPDVIAARGSAT